MEPYRIHSFYNAIVDCVYEHFEWNEKVNLGKKQNIIFDCYNGLPLGGVEAWSISLLHEFVNTDREAYLLSPYGEYNISSDTKKRVLWVESKPEKIFDWKNIENILKVLQTKLSFTFISSFINDMFLAACCLKRKYPNQVKIISVVHQGFTVAYKEHIAFNQYVESYIAVSKDIQKGLIKYGIESKKVLHMTCPVSCIDPYVREYSLDNKYPVKIGYAGRIEPIQKRMDCLVDLLTELERLHTSYYMEIAGTGSYFEQLKRDIKKYGLENKVVMLGEINRTEIAKFWSRQDICINLSDYEGRSISIMEAMINGAVPIVTNTSGVKEDIRESFNGHIVDIGDYATMAIHINHMENNRNLLLLYGKRTHDIMIQKSNMNIHMNFWNSIV